MNKVIFCLFIFCSSEVFAMGLVQRLIGKGWFETIKSGDLDAVRDLIDREYNVNNVEIVSGENGLHKAVCIKNRHAYIIAALLLEYGIEVDHVASNGHTPLLDAVLQKKRMLVDLLVRAGANYDYQQRENIYSPRQCAQEMEWAAGISIFDYYVEYPSQKVGRFNHH